MFIGFFAAALAHAAAAIVIGARRRGADRVRTWRAVRDGAVVLIAALIAGGVVSFVAFATLFEVFHRLFFAGGSYTFDPTIDRLVQLFPFAFWQETAIVVGAVCIVIAGVVAWFATRRAEAVQAATQPRPGRCRTDGTSAATATTGRS